MTTSNKVTLSHKNLERTFLLLICGHIHIPIYKIISADISVYPFKYLNVFSTSLPLCLCFRFTGHAHQYASTPQATSAPLGRLHPHHPHPQCLACASAPLTHSLPGAGPGRKLPLLATRAFSGFSYHETAPTEDHPAGGQRKSCINRPDNSLNYIMCSALL